MTKFTPGPWKVHRHSHADGELWLSVVNGAWDITHNSAAQPGVIADAAYSAMPDAENEANAVLIAAAPELFEALKNAVHALQYCMNHHMPDDEMLRPKCQKNIDTARVALLKASPKPDGVE